MNGQTHRLKTWPEFFHPIRQGVKNFEVRRNDRNFKSGDILVLAEWDRCRKCFGAGIWSPDDINTVTCPECSGSCGKYTGNALTKRVDYIMHGPAFGLTGGYCVMSISDLPHNAKEVR